MMVACRMIKRDKSVPTAAFISVSEYIATSYRPDQELVDGQLLERNIGEYDHSSLQGALVTWLPNRQREWNIRVLPEQGVRVAPNPFRIPDICVLRASSLSSRYSRARHCSASKCCPKTIRCVACKTASMTTWRSESEIFGLWIQQSAGPTSARGASCVNPKMEN